MVLYKYRDWSNEFHKRIITHSELFFSSANSFNDPFDARLSLDYSNYTDEDWRKGYHKHLEKENPKSTAEEIKEIVNNWMDKKLYKNPAHLKSNKEFVYKKNIKDFGIISLSGINYEILLWSHYAASHTGFCVGFNKEKLLEYRLIASKTYDLFYDCFEVEYNKEYPKLDAKKLDDQMYVLKPLIIKSDKWKYEKESRLILINGTNKVMLLNNDIYEEIILGAKISEEYKTEILQIVNTNFPNVKISQSQICEDKYCIEIVRIK